MEIVEASVSAGGGAIFDWDLPSGLSHHVGMRCRADVLPFDPAIAKTIFRRYFGPVQSEWDPRFNDVVSGAEPGLTIVRLTPETVVIRDQSYKPTTWTRSHRSVAGR